MQRDLLAYHGKESTPRGGSIMENTDLSKQQQVSEIIRARLTLAQKSGKHFANDHINETPSRVSAEVGLVHQHRDADFRNRIAHGREQWTPTYCSCIRRGRRAGGEFHSECLRGRRRCRGRPGGAAVRWKKARRCRPCRRASESAVGARPMPVMRRVKKRAPSGRRAGARRNSVHKDDDSRGASSQGKQSNSLACGGSEV